MTVEELKVLISAETSGLRKEIKNVQNQLSTLDKQSTKVTNRMSGAFKKIAKAFSIGAITAGLFRIGKSALSAASDLEEIQNVVDVAFGDAAKEINRFAKTCMLQFGLSEASAKQMASTFMAIGSSMGIANNSAKIMSVQLTGLAADMASFYNTSVESVSSALEGIYTGQTRALRQYGIVLDDATLAEYALSQGITKSISSMNQAEKATLRYNYVLQQTANAQNDFARTSGSWANSIRVLRQQWNAFMAELGGVITAVLAPIVKWLATILSYLSAVVRAFKSVFGIASGTIDDTAKSTKSLAENIGGVSSGFSSAAKSAQKLKKTIAGFDELEVLNSQEDSGGGGAGDIGGGGFDVGTYFDPDSFELPDTSEFEKQMTGVIGILKEFVEFVMGPITKAAKWLTDYIYPVIGQDEEGKDIRGWDWKHIFNLAGLVAAGAAVLKIIKKAFGNPIENIKEALSQLPKDASLAVKLGIIGKSIKGLGGSAKEAGKLLITAFKKLISAAFNPVTIAVALLAGGFITMWKNSDKFRNAVKGEIMPILKKLGDTFTQVWTNHIKPLWESIKKFVDEVAYLIKWLWKNVLAPIFGTIGATLLVLVTDIMGAIGQLIAWIAAGLADVLRWVLDCFSGMRKACGDLIEWLRGVWDKFKEALLLIWGGLKEGWTNFTAALRDRWAEICEAIKNFFSGVRDALVAIWGGLKEGWSGFTTALKTTWDNWCSGIKTAFQGVKDFFVGLWEGLKTGWTTFIDKLKSGWDTMCSGLRTAFSNVWTFLVELLRQKVNGVIGIINGILYAVEKAIGGIVKALNKISFTLPSWVPLIGGKSLGFNLTAPTLPRLSYLAQGGVLDEPTAAMMGEYPGVKNNPEIVTPENLMRQIFSESNDDLADTIIAGVRQIVQAISENQVDIRIGDDVISAAAARGDRDYKKRTGRSQFA